jgi:GNAT superfamily N-acetyltransferase
VEEDIFEKYDLIDVREEFPIPSLPAEGLILIVGSSGSGKSTILRETFNQPCIEWTDNPIWKDFSNPHNAEKFLLACGLRTVPAWKRPFDQLSNGEQHRATCARILDQGLESIDEFTSVVDRNTAKSLSFAIGKHFRSSGMKRLVIATCHDDVEEWLLPDFVYNTDTRSWENRRYLRRPEIRIDIKACEGPTFWPIFQKHHYLSGEFNARCNSFICLIDEKPVAFVSLISFPGIKNSFREHRTVVLPEFQGLGIGNRCSEAVADQICRMGYRFFSKTSHPAMGEHRNKSPLWRGTSKNGKKRPDYSETTNNRYPNRGIHQQRRCYAHEYIGHTLEEQPSEAE